MSAVNVVKAFGDSYVLSYEKKHDQLSIKIRLWDESCITVVAADVKQLKDSGTWEAEGIIRLEELDDGEHLGYGIVDTDQNPTLQFTARTLTISEE